MSLNMYWPNFGFGHDLYEAQVIYADADKRPITKEEVQKLSERFQHLAHATGQLCAEHSDLKKKHDDLKKQICQLHERAQDGNRTTSCID